jgi:hypothetical protein
MSSSAGLAFGVVADARARQHRRRQRVIGTMLGVALLSAVLGYAAVGGNGPGPRAPGPVTESSARFSRDVTLRLPPGRATETFTISAPAEHAYDATLAAPAGSAIVVAVTIAGGGWTLATREDAACGTSAGRTLCLLHFAAGGNPGGTWTATVHKYSSPAVDARISVVFAPRAGVYRSAR